jgi:hypothetical protein
MLLGQRIVWFLTGFATCFASSIPGSSVGHARDLELHRRQSPTPSSPVGPPDPECTNGPSTRACWGDGFSIATNFDFDWPDTGNIVEYSLEITNTTMAPDGFERLVMAVNGQFPGPTLHAGRSFTKTLKYWLL